MNVANTAVLGKGYVLTSRKLDKLLTKRLRLSHKRRMEDWSK